MKFRYRSWVVSAIIGWPLAVGAWSPLGHSFVGHLAESRLTPRTREAVREILGEHKLSDYEVGSWADIIRGTREYDERYPRNGAWHFVEFDVSLRYNDQFELTLPEHGNDIVTQIRRWRGELAFGQLEGEARLDALRFLVHLVGDIHQPLHCAFRYGDMGGNMLPVSSFEGRYYSYDEDTPMDYASSVHSVWDGALLNELMAGTDEAALAQRLSEGISPRQVEWWSRDDPYVWAVDSYWRARKEAYRWADGSNLPYTWMRPGMVMTSENYIDSKLPIVEEQLQKAGVRLARSLNLAFDPEFAAAAGFAGAVP